ncbi:MAG: CotH kinase family protein [Mariprofundus sp.]|nr:CotH kinase family protein [Mariprofundus sp.]
MKPYKLLPLYGLPLLCLSWPVGALYAVEDDSNALLEGLSLQQLESPGLGQMNQPVMIAKNGPVEVETVAVVQAENIATVDQATHTVNEAGVIGGDGSGEPDSRWYGFNSKATLRAGPNVKFDAVAWARKDSRALELDRKGEWVRIQLQHNKRIGWVFESLLLPLNGIESVSMEMLPVESIVAHEQAAEQAGQQPLQAPLAKAAALESVEKQQPAQSIDQQPVEQKPIDQKSIELKSIDQKPVDIAVAKTPAVKTDRQQGDVLQGFEQETLQTVMIRAEASSLSEMLGWLGSGAVVDVLAQQGKWTKVRMQKSGRVGWVESTALQQPVAAKADQTLREQAVREKIVTQQAVKQQAVSAQPKSAQSEAAQSEAAQSESAQPEPVQSTSTPSVQQQRVAADVYRFNRKSNLRAGPDLKYDVVAWAGNGSQASMLERQGDWLRIQMQESKRIGWVFHNALNPIQGAVQTAAEPAAKTTIEPVMKQQPVESIDQQPVDQKSIEQKPIEQKPVDIAVAKTPAVKTDSQMNGVLHGSGQETLQTVMIRAEASSLSEMLGWLGSGTVVDVLAQQGKWTKVRMQKSGRIGWVESAALQQPVATKADKLGIDKAVSAQTGSAQSVSAQSVSAQSVSAQPVSAQPVSEKPISTPSVQQQGVDAVVQTDSHLYRFNRTSNLRAGPDLKYDVVTWAGNGSQALLLERQGDWMRVQMQLSKRIGWVFHSSLYFVKGAVLSATEHATEDLTKPVTKSTTTPAMKAAVKSTAANVATPRQQSVPDAIEAVDDQATHQTYLFKRTSDMRSGPGKGYARIGWGGRNESAEEIGRQGNWKHVRMTISGKEGWVFSSYLERVADAASYDAVKPPAAPVALSAAQQTGSVYQVLRTEPLRSEAGDFAELIGSVSKGDMVTWLEVKNGWVKVSPKLLDSKPGWIQAKLLKQGDLRTVEHKKAIMNKANAVVYKDRISKGKTFNYSFAALDEALYRIPVEDIHIRIDKDDLKALFLKRQYDKSSFDVSIKTGRHKLHGRVKVLGSSTRIFKKKSLLLKLDKESARWYGHRRIALRSMASDKSLMREWMAWKMMAALGMKVPEVHFTRLSFNHGEKTGLYLSIEWMGPEFLEANDLDVRGEFYQPNDATHCGDLYTTDNLQTCFDKITPQDDDYSQLKRMAIAVNAANNDDIDKVLENYFDVESVINWITVNALLTNGDTYNKNYWLYFYPAERRWTLVPWDYNLTFGRTYDQYGSRNFRIFNDNFQYYYPPDVGAGNPIKDKALRNPKLRAQMETKIKHLIGMQPNGSEQTFGWFSPTVMHARIGNLATVVGKELYKDTFLSYGEEDFTKTYESLMHYVTAHDYFLKTKLFGDFEWNPEPPNQGFVSIPLPGQLLGSGALKAGSESLHLIDRGWGYFVAQLDLDQALESKAEFEVRVEGGITPKYLPTGQSARRCIERSWLLRIKTAKVSTTANVMFEYAQENSRRSEVPPSIHEELLELWMLDGNHWKPVQTEVNEYSNTVLAKGIHIESGHSYRFVACSPF